jgi:hypothetical protein
MNFSIVNFLAYVINIPSSPAYGVYISQLIRYASAYSTHDQFEAVYWQANWYHMFLQSRLQAALRKSYGCYNDLVCQYSLSVGHMLSDVFR